MLNGEKELYLSQENVKVRLTAKTTYTTHHNIEIKIILGDVSVNTDELKLIFIPSIDDRYSRMPTFYYDKEIVKGIFDAKQGKSFECRFSLPFSSTEGVPEETLILPSDFIMHDGKPLITDTIRISLKSFIDNNRQRK
jgi:hypothetical protein